MITLSEEVCKKYLLKLKNYGEEGLYRRIVGEAFIKLDKQSNPPQLILDYSNAFFQLFRRTGQEEFFIIGKVLRRAAHVIYRELVRQNKTKVDYKRFLNVI